MNYFKLISNWNLITYLNYHNDCDLIVCEILLLFNLKFINLFPRLQKMYFLIQISLMSRCRVTATRNNVIILKKSVPLKYYVVV